MTPRFWGFTIAGTAAVLAVVAACRSTTKPADPIGDLQARANTEIGAAVKDPGRLAQVEPLFREAFDTMRQMWKESSEYRAKSDALNADYDATPKQFRELYAGHSTRQKALLKQAVEIRGRVAGALTEEEWARLAGIRADVRSLGLAID